MWEWICFCVFYINSFVFLEVARKGGCSPLAPLIRHCIWWGLLRLAPVTFKVSIELCIHSSTYVVSCLWYPELPTRLMFMWGWWRVTKWLVILRIKMASTDAKHGTNCSQIDNYDDLKPAICLSSFIQILSWVFNKD